MTRHIDADAERHADAMPPMPLCLRLRRAAICRDYAERRERRHYYAITPPRCADALRRRDAAAPLPPPMPRRRRR